MVMVKRYCVLALVVLITGCVNLAPDYQRPHVALADTWIAESLGEQNSSNKQALRVPQWREFFLDPQLQALITMAFENNHDVKKAALNGEIAQRKLGISRAEYLPVVGLSAYKQRARTVGTGVGERYQVGLGVSNFELDFFGRVKNQSQAALNQYLQTQEARDAAQLSIIDAVAKTYFQWRVQKSLVATAKSLVNVSNEALRIAQTQYREGMVALADVESARIAADESRAQYQKMLREHQQSHSMLVKLVGKPFAVSKLPASYELSRQLSNAQLYVNIPSEVLQNRPDIRQAEYGLKAAYADVGVARARLYPSIKLTGNAGFMSGELRGLFDSVGKVWSFMPSIDLPIFDMGRRKAGVEISELQRQVAVETYTSAVQTAFKEVADALYARKSFDDEYRAQQKRTSSALRLLNIARVQMREGFIGRQQLLGAQRTAFALKQQTLATLLQRLVNRVQLFTALGGGVRCVDKASRRVF